MPKKSSSGFKRPPTNATQVYADEKSRPPKGTSGHSKLPRITADQPVQISATKMSAAPSETSGHSPLRRLVGDTPIRVTKKESAS